MEIELDEKKQNLRDSMAMSDAFERENLQPIDNFVPGEENFGSGKSTMVTASAGPQLGNSYVSMQDRDTFGVGY